MKKIIKNSSIFLSLIIFFFIYLFILLSKYLKYSESITAAFLLLLTFASILLFGFQKNKNTFLSKNVFLLVLTQIVLYFVVIYIGGIFIGFLKNSYSLKILSIIDNILAPIIIIITMEIIRYVVIWANKNNKFVIVLLTIIFVLFEAMMSIKAYSLNNVLGLFKFVTLIILPLIMKHSVLSYLNYHVGFKTPLLYRLLLDTYFYLVPIVPDLGDYLNSIIGIGFPFLVYFNTSKIIIESNYQVEHYFYKNAFGFQDIIFICIIVMLFFLMSGYFKYSIMAIGSSSMEPKIKKGDIIFVEKYKNQESIKKGDVIVYIHKKVSIVHRVVDIKEENGVLYYYTKGDANNKTDDINVKYKNIKGKVVATIPYLGRPAIYLSELINKE